MKGNYMKKLGLKVTSVLSIFAFVFAISGCGSAPDEGTTTAASNNLYCAVSDGGGFQDKSFNQSAKAGLDQASAELGITNKAVESKNENDYAPNIDSAIAENCKLIFTVGFNLADGTKAAAEANPDKNFAILDDNSINLPNVKPIVYNTAEAAYLGGYLAAAVSKSKTIATWGGMAIPSVQIFSDGFYQGAEAYNKAHSDSVKVLGWDPTNASKYQTVQSFTDASKGKQLSQTFIKQGADVIMPVAGGAGNGAAQAAVEKKVKLVWVDTDGYNTLDDKYKPFLLTSVLKNISETVVNVVKEDQTAFSADPYVGTIANDGVGLAPFHDLDSEVSADVKAEIEKLTADIKSGALVITSEFSPKATPTETTAS
jgi:basic membrane protein A